MKEWLVRGGCGLVLGALASGASAQTFQGCKGPQVETIESVLPVAEIMAERAAAAVGNTPEYTRWFGPYSDKYADTVRASLKGVHRAMIRDEMEFICAPNRSPDCSGGTYAFVFTTEAYVVTLCSSFFEMPRMDGGDPEAPEYENGTMAGTIIHELSHFDVVAGTDDICYSRTDCSAMARRAPDDAVINADSYQYFAEDVMFSLVDAETSGRE